MSESTAKLVFDIVIALFSFFVTSPMITNAIGQFTVQTKLFKRVVNEGIIAGDKVNGAKDLLKSKKTAGISITLIIFIVILLVSIKNAPWSYVCVIVGLITGIWKFRKACQYNSFTMKSFKKSFQNFIDKAKFEELEMKEFNNVN